MHTELAGGGEEQAGQGSQTGTHWWVGKLESSWLTLHSHAALGWVISRVLAQSPHTAL